MNMKKIKSSILSHKVILMVTSFFLIQQFMELAILNHLDKTYLSLCQWDCGWYKGIVESGYQATPSAHANEDAANWAFFPFLPTLAYTLNIFFGVGEVSSLLIISKFSFLLSIFAFVKMCSLYSDRIPVSVSAAVIAFSPYSIYANSGYTESTFMLLTCLFFIALKSDKRLSAGIIGALLSATRLVGVFVTIPYVLHAIKKIKDGDKDYSNYILPILVIPLGAAIFSLHLYYVTGDALAFSHIQRAWGREPGNPFAVLWQGISGNGYELYLSMCSLFALLVCCILLEKKFYSFAVFSLFCTLIPLSTEILSMPRYVFWQAPILFAIAYAFKSNRSSIAIFIMLAPLQAYYYREWLAGAGWLI